MADPLPCSCVQPRVPVTYDGRDWHFHHERELPRTIELLAALMAAEHGDGAPYRWPEDLGFDRERDESFPCPCPDAAQVPTVSGADVVVAAASVKPGTIPPWEGRMAS